MSVLSERDIIRQLGTGIVILPFKEKKDSLRGCCINLTASEYAYVFTKENNEGEPTNKGERLKIENNYLIVPKRRTAVVWTEEFIFLSNLFCGSLHSRVRLVSKGLGHIGTRVNPNWGGIMAIALHNLSDDDVEIKVGDTIAYLRVHKLSSKSSSPRQLDTPGKMQDAIPPDFDHPVELSEWLQQRHQDWNTSDEVAFRKQFKTWHEYRKVKLALYKEHFLWDIFIRLFGDLTPTNWIGIIGILVPATITVLINHDKILSILSKFQNIY